MQEATSHDFANGDAVIAIEGDMEVTGVVSEVYDDVVAVDFFNEEEGMMDSMEFHVDFVKPYL